MQRCGITKLAGKNNYISLHIVQGKWEYRTHSSTYRLFLFDTSIDIVSETLFYLLNVCVRYQYRYCIEHTIPPTRLLIPIHVQRTYHKCTQPSS